MSNAITPEQVKVGQWVQSQEDFAGVLAGTAGLIDELHEGGFMVAWHLEGQPVPDGWAWRGQRQAEQPLRDRFSYKDDLESLKLTEAPADWTHQPSF